MRMSRLSDLNSGGRTDMLRMEMKSPPRPLMNACFAAVGVRGALLYRRYRIERLNWSA